MRLVFVHGWGFDAAIWNELSAALGEFPQTRVDFGFLGASSFVPAFTPDDVLIGHSLGLLWGLSYYGCWQRVIAVNSFATFASGEGAAVAPSALRAMRLSLVRDPKKTLANFYRSVGLSDAPERFDAGRLSEGLSLLESEAIKEPLLPPALVLACANDPLVPATATDYLAHMAKTSAICHDTGGHLLPLRDASWCADRIRAFLG